MSSVSRFVLDDDVNVPSLPPVPLMPTVSSKSYRTEATSAMNLTERKVCSTVHDGTRLPPFSSNIAVGNNSTMQNYAVALSPSASSAFHFVSSQDSLSNEGNLLVDGCGDNFKSFVPSFATTPSKCQNNFSHVSEINICFPAATSNAATSPFLLEKYSLSSNKEGAKFNLNCDNMCANHVSDSVKTSNSSSALMHTSSFSRSSGAVPKSRIVIRSYETANSDSMTESDLDTSNTESKHEHIQQNKSFVRRNHLPASIAHNKSSNSQTPVATSLHNRRTPRLHRSSSLEEDEIAANELVSPFSRWVAQPKSYRGPKREQIPVVPRRVNRKQLGSHWRNSVAMIPANFTTTDGETSGVGSSLDDLVESSTESEHHTCIPVQQEHVSHELLPRNTSRNNVSSTSTMVIPTNSLGASVKNAYLKAVQATNTTGLSSDFIPLHQENLPCEKSFNFLHKNCDSFSNQMHSENVPLSLASSSGVDKSDYSSPLVLTGTDEAQSSDTVKDVSLQNSILTPGLPSKRRGGWPKGRKRKPELAGAKRPKAPLSAYVLYLTERRKTFRELNPRLGFGEVTRRIGAEWRSLPDAQRAYYKGRADMERRRYKNELQAFRQSHEFQLMVRKKRLKGEHPEDSSDCTDGPEDESSEELYCTKCDKLFSSLHNKRVHMYGRPHKRQAQAARRNRSSCQATVDDNTDLNTDYNTDYNTDCNTDYNTDCNTDYNTDYNTDCNTDYDDSSTTTSVSHYRQPRARSGCSLASSSAPPTPPPLVVQTPALHAPAPHRKALIAATSASEDEEIQFPRQHIHHRDRCNNVATLAIAEEGHEGDKEDGGEDDDIPKAPPADSLPCLPMTSHKRPGCCCNEWKMECRRLRAVISSLEQERRKQHINHGSQQHVEVHGLQQVTDRNQQLANDRCQQLVDVRSQQLFDIGSSQYVNIRSQQHVAAVNEELHNRVATTSFQLPIGFSTSQSCNIASSQRKSAGAAEISSSLGCASKMTFVKTAESMAAIVGDSIQSCVYTLREDENSLQGQCLQDSELFSKVQSDNTMNTLSGDIVLINIGNNECEPKESRVLSHKIETRNVHSNTDDGFSLRSSRTSISNSQTSYDASSSGIMCGTKKFNENNGTAVPNSSSKNYFSTETKNTNNKIPFIPYVTTISSVKACTSFNNKGIKEPNTDMIYKMTAEKIKKKPKIIVCKPLRYNSQKECGVVAQSLDVGHSNEHELASNTSSYDTKCYDAKLNLPRITLPVNSVNSERMKYLRNILSECDSKCSEDVNDNDTNVSVTKYCSVSSEKSDCKSAVNSFWRKPNLISVDSNIDSDSSVEYVAGNIQGTRESLYSTDTEDYFSDTMSTNATLNRLTLRESSTKDYTLPTGITITSASPQDPSTFSSCGTDHLLSHINDYLNTGEVDVLPHLDNSGIRCEAIDTWLMNALRESPPWSITTPVRDQQPLSTGANSVETETFYTGIQLTEDDSSLVPTPSIAYLAMNGDHASDSCL